MLGGYQTISIGRGCEYKPIVQHEILHALGRIHEQSRPDRNRYVTINRENIKKGIKNDQQCRLTKLIRCISIELVHNFEIMKANTGGLPYDYGSVMHYGAYDFSSNGKPTITPHQQVSIGQRRGLSDTDWKHLMKAYCSRDQASQSLGR